MSDDWDKKDLSDWASAVEDVKPLKDRPRKLVKDALVEDFSNLERKPKQSKPQLQSQPASAPLPNRPPLTVISREADDFGGYRPGLDRRQFKQLAEGRYAYEARIDLHGLVLDDAWKTFADFLLEAYHHGCRCVLVVHGKGKGYGPEGNMGIIKSSVLQWLEHHPYVLAYHHAIARHGGTGAVYVLLERAPTQQAQKDEPFKT